MSSKELLHLDHGPNKEEKVLFWDAFEMCQIDGFWYAGITLGAINAFRANFKPSRDDVVILASARKTGTTWLKALSHSILFREEEDDSLAIMNPHGCVPTFESTLYLDHKSNPCIDPDRRLYHTHIPYSYLPESITSKQKTNESCKLVYITRDPKDTLISQWHFYNKIFGRDDHQGGPFPLEKAVDSFCSGVMPFGPYWDHVLEYWEESKKSPDKVMFLKYEDLRLNPKPHVRKLAAFLGRPFVEDEEVEKVIWRSSFDRLKDLDINKTGKPPQAHWIPSLRNSHFFRRGEVGDWRNYLSLGMTKRIDDITRDKFRGTGLRMDDEETP
ncbi:Cytosolic sulfotransferase 5 [Linum grandiflorum]